MGNMNSALRTSILGLVFAGLLATLTLRLWTMQVTEAAEYEDRALNNQVKVVTTPAPRGDIFSANGVKLAGTRSALAAIVDLALVNNDEIQMLARNLAAFLDEDTETIAEQLKNPPPGGRVTVATDITDYEATFLVEHRERFPGINIIPQPIRIYPEGEIGAHVLGYIGRPNEEDLLRENVKGTTSVGKAGVERSYDDVLLGTEGVVTYQVDAKRKVLSLSGEVEPTAGGSLILTIDSDVQRQLQRSLRDGLMLSRKVEMDKRAVELSRQSVPERLAAAQAKAEDDARRAATETDSSSADDTPADTDGSAPSVDDDDVDPTEQEPVTIDPATVLASLYPGLPIDSDGVCVPVVRVEVPLRGDASLSGREPRFIRLESVVDQDGEFKATVSVAGEKFFVGRDDLFASTLQVLAVEEERLIVYHSDKWCPIRSVGVVEDPTDGSIIAMGSYPDYDPSVFVDGLSDEQWASLSTVFAFQNFAVQGLYAPASTFKVVPYILAVEENFYPIDRGLGDKQVGDDASETQKEPVALTTHTDEYSCTGEFKFTLNDGTVQTKRDWRWPGGHGPLDLHGALQASCDLYFWDVALRLWEERGDDSGFDKENLLQEYARAFGFGTASGIDLPFERDGLIPDRAWFSAEQSAATGRVRDEGPWVGGDLMDIAVGQGATLTTPLQLANAFSAMVNGGTLWRPRVVQEVVNSDGEVIDENPKAMIRKIDLSPLTVELLLSDLQQVVNNQQRGTGRTAFSNFGPNVELVGGKTGTGEVISARGAADFEEVDNAWFVGVAPINAPKYVVSIVVERGGSGGQIAAPIARQILQYLLNGPDGVTILAPGLDAD